MGKTRYYSELQKEEIVALKRATEGSKLYRKALVLDYSAKGLKGAEIARLTDYSLSRVSDFVSEYFEHGIGYFTEEHRKGGNRRNLSKESERKILSKYEERAKNGQVVSLGAIKAEYEKERGKETANSTLYYFMHKMGWRRVMPRGQHPEKASEEEIDSSKKLTLSIQTRVEKCRT